MNKSALIQLTLAMAIFGSIGFFSLHTGLPAIELVFLRCVCALLLLFGAWIVSGNHKKERWQSRETGLIALCGITNLLNWVFLFKSFLIVSVTIAISLYHLAPFIVMMAGSFLFRDKLTFTSVFALAGCFAGTLFIMGTDGFNASASNWEGMIYGVAAAVFYAATILLGKSIRKTSVYATTWLQMLIGLLALLPFVHFETFEGLRSDQWTYAILTGIVHTGLVYLLFFHGIRHLPSPVVSLLVFVDPAVAILLDIAVTGFRPSFLQASGIALLFGSLLAAVVIPLVRSKRQV